MKTLTSLLAIMGSVSVMATFQIPNKVNQIAIGGVDGGGGNAVVCRDENGQVQSARMFDLYEGEVLYGLKYREVIDEEDTLLEILFDIYGPEEYLTQFHYFNLVKFNFKFLPSGTKLKTINDSGHIFTPANCEIEQVANYYNPLNVFINTDIFDKFSPLDRLALHLHEHIFAVERTMGVSDSRYTRRVVSRLLSEGYKASNPNEGINLVKDHLCVTNDTNPYGDTSKTTQFYAIDQGKGYWRFQFQFLNGHKIYSKKYADLYIGSEVKFPLDQYNSQPSGSSTINMGVLDSSIDPGETIVLHLNDGEIDMGGKSIDMKLKWSGFDPGDGHDFRSFTCYKIQLFGN